MDTNILSRQQQLADRIRGEILGPSTIKVGDHLVVASVAGVVRVDGHVIGRWSDGIDILATGYRTEVAERADARYRDWCRQAFAMTIRPEDVDLALWQAELGEQS